MSAYHGPVTNRQIQILRGIADGLTNEQIAHELGIKPGTVKGHITFLFRRLDVADRTTAAIRGQALGVVAIPTSVGRDTWTAS